VNVGALQALTVRWGRPGGFWDFTPNLEHADTAYTTLALGAHTDTTYFTDPIGYHYEHAHAGPGEGGGRPGRLPAVAGGVGGDPQAANVSSDRV
jgi:hypothetical protein